MQVDGFESRQVFSPQPGGRLDQNAARRLNLNGAAMLDHLGFAPGTDPTEREWRFRAGKIVESLRQRPNQMETAIDLPARLTLSPSQRAIFLAPQGINPGIFNLSADGNATAPPATPVALDETGVPLTRVPSSCTEQEAAYALWSVDLLTRPGDPKPDLRAVHSPDLSPNVLMKLYAQKFDTDTFAPMRGPEAPWYLSRSDSGQAEEDPLDYAKGTLRAQGALWDRSDTGTAPSTDAPKTVDTAFLDFPTDSADACTRLAEPDRNHDLLAMLPGRFRELCRKFTRRRNPPAKFRTSMDAYDRHELVLLSSAYGLPVAPRSGGGSKTTSLGQETQFKPDERYELIDVMRDQEIYVPQPLNVSLLSLTALGGSLVHDTGFTPPASARHGRDGANLFDALSIERWQYAAFLGRDIYCEVVYKGYLCPLGIPASLVKVTERVIAPEENGRGGVTNPNRRRYTAFLRQRMFIRVGRPEKTFPALGQPLEGRRMPCNSLVVLTRTTPDIIDPTAVGFEVNSDPAPIEHASGRILFNNLPGLVFWPRTHFSAKGDVRFEMLMDDSFASLPLLFVDNVAANDPRTLADLTDYYNCEGEKGVRGVRSPDIEPEPISNQSASPPTAAVPTASEATQLEDVTEAARSGSDSAESIVPEKHRRTLVFNGAPLRYADEMRSNDCTLETIALTLRMEGRSTNKAAPQGKEFSGIPVYDFDHDRMVFDGALRVADQPPFYPAMESTRVLLTSNAQLTGAQAKPRRAVYDGEYLANGFKPAEGDAELVLPEIFLNLIDDEPQDQGDRGDQSGGVFRPQGTLRMISRDKGPVAGSVALTKASYQSGRVPSLKSILSQKPSANSRQSGAANDAQNVRELEAPSMDGLLSNIFGDAKLLGMVPLSKLVSTIATMPGVLSGKNAPELKQTVDFGISVVEQAGRAAGGFADLVRREVLVPLRELVTEAQTRWDALDADLTTRQQAANPVDKVVTPVKLDELFPEIDAGLAALDQALTAAIETEDTLALATALSRVHEAGRRFIAALGRAASEVVERFEIALTARFEALRGPLDRLVELVDGNTQKLLKTVKEEAIAWIPSKIIPEPANGAPAPVAILVLPNPLRSTLEPMEAAALQQALTLTGNDVRKVARDVLKAVLANVIDKKAPFSENALVALNQLITERKEAVKAVINDFAAAKKEQARVELAEYTVLAEWLLAEPQFDLLIAGKFDELRQRAKDDMERLLDNLNAELGARVAASEAVLNAAIAQIEARLISVLSLVMAEIAPYLLYVRTAEQRWKAVEESLSGTNLLTIAESIEALLSHLLQRRIALVEGVVGTKITQGAAIVGKYISGLDVGALELVSATGPYSAGATQDYPWVYVEAMKISDIPGPVTAPDQIPGEPLRGLIDALNELINASVAWQEFSVGDDPNSDSDLAKLKNGVTGLADELEAAHKKIDALFAAGYNTLWSLICDLVNDAYAIAGLKARLATIAQNVTALDIVALTGVEELRRDLKRIAAARQQAFQRNIRSVETFEGALLAALKDGTIQSFAGLVATIKVISPDPGDQAKVIGAKLARQAGGALRWLVAQLTKGLAQIEPLGVNAADSQETVADLLSNQELIGLLRSLGLHDLISGLVESLRAAAGSIAAASTDLKGLPNPTTTGPITRDNYSAVLAEEKKWLEALKSQQAQISSLNGNLEEVREQLNKLLSAEDIPQKFLSALTLRAQQALNEWFDEIATSMLKAINLSGVYAEAVKARAALMPNPDDPIAIVLGPVLIVEMRPDDPRMKTLQDASGKALYTPPTGQTFTIKDDMLAADVAYLAEAVRIRTPISDERFRTFLQVFVADWSRGKSAPQVILAGIGEAVRRLLRGDIDLDDLFDIREQIEAKLLDLVPTKRKFEYTLDFPLPKSQVEAATLGFLVPGEGCRLDVGAVTEIDLLPNGIPQDGLSEIRPSMRASTLATLGPFDIKLVGEFFDALTIKFAGARFSSDFGGETDFKAFYSDVVIGKQLQFLEELSTYLSPGNGNGAFVDILRDRPGIEAGYKLNLGTIMLGNIIFANIGLFVSAEIPFDNSPALFKTSLGRRDAMFSISYAPFGGEGFFGVIANVEGIIGFEMALGFGGIVPFQIGALEGVGRVTSGFYIRKMALEDGREVTEISATCFVGGACKISIFSLCASLSVRMTQKESGAMSGIAIFTYSFSLGLADFDFTIRFSKTEKKGFGKTEGGAKENDGNRAALRGRSRFAELGHSPIRIAELTTSARPPRPSETPKILNKTISPFVDWGEAQRHLSPNSPKEDLLW